MSDLRLAVGTDNTTAAADNVLRALDEVRVIVRVDGRSDAFAASAAGALVSMLGRLHAHVEIDGDADCGRNPWAAETVTDVLARLTAQRPVPSATPVRDLIVGVGLPGDLCIGGDDWTARIGREPSIAAGSSSGLGLHAAAAFAAAEVFKRTLGPLGMSVVPAEFEWDLLTYRYGRSDPPPPIKEPEPLLFAAAGSVNSSAAAQLMGLRMPGRAVVVDPDAFDSERNPYRYPASTGTTEGAKATWVAGLLSAAGWDATGIVTGIGDWVCSQPQPGFDGVLLSSVDSVTGRGEVADVLARTTLSAGVHGLRLHVQREHCFDAFACPNCDFVAEGDPITQVQVVADMTGIELARAAELLLGAGLTSEDLAVVVGSGRLGAANADALVGRRVQDLLGRLYAEASVPVVGSDAVRVSAPFVSWISGTLLAVEVAKTAARVPLVGRRVDLDMAGVPAGAVGRRPRDPDGRCTCVSRWRRRAAQRLYGKPEALAV